MEIKAWQIERIFLFNGLRYPNELFFSKVSRLPPFALVAQATCAWWKDTER